jgi:flagellar hook-associated protein 2
MDGINSGSFRFSGLATGLDTAALVEAFLQLERRPLDLVEERKEGLEKQQSLFRDLNTRLLALRDAARALDNQNPRLSGPTLDEEFLAYSAASSDDGVLTGTANGNAAVGSTSIRVLSLASVARRVSTAFSSDTDPIASSGDTLSIDYGGDESIDITVGAAGASLRDLRDLVNSDPSNGGEVRAEVLFDGSAYRLIVSGGRTGAGNDVALTTTIAGEGGNSFLDVALGQDAADARLEVLGIPVTRPSNEIDDVVPGVTLQLRGTTDALDAGDVVQLDVTRDDAAIAGKLQTLIDAYNGVRDFVGEQSAFDEDAGRAGPLSGDATIRGIEREVQKLVGNQYAFSGNPFGFLSQIGVSFDRDGRLSLDGEKLAAALKDDPIGVRELLAGDGTSDGLATALARALEPVTRSGDGSLALRDGSFDDRIEEVERQIERYEARLAQREESLVRTFTGLESTVSRLQSQSGFLSSIVAF